MSIKSKSRLKALQDCGFSHRDLRRKQDKTQLIYASHTGLPALVPIRSQDRLTTTSDLKLQNSGAMVDLDPGWTTSKEAKEMTTGGLQEDQRPPIARDSAGTSKSRICVGIGRAQMTVLLVFPGYSADV